MMRLDDLSRLLAIALLNVADDEGYFYADEDVIRGQVFPKKDSTNIRRALDELSRTGYLSVHEHPTHGKIGHIVSFASHQRVDRPNSSKIKGFYDSTNVRRIIDEDSTTEQGTGNREGKGGGMDGSPSPAPELAELMPTGAAKDMLALQAKVQAIRPGWNKAMTYEEQQCLMRNGSFLDSLTDDDWKRIKAYMSAKMPEGAGFWQPPTRSRFINAIGDVHEHALRWEGKGISQPKRKGWG